MVAPDDTDPFSNAEQILILENLLFEELNNSVFSLGGMFEE